MDWRHAPFNIRHWSIGRRLVLIVATVAVPLNLLIISVILSLANASIESQRTNLLFNARSVAAGVDAQLGKYLAIAHDLEKSRALLQDDLTEFEAEALQSIAGVPDAWVLVADLEGQQLLNTALTTGAALPKRSPEALMIQAQTQNSGKIAISTVRQGVVIHDWIASVEVPIFKSGKPFRQLAIGISLPVFLNILRAQETPRGWLTGIIDGDGRFVVRVPGSDTRVGQLASEGWRRVKDQEGSYEFTSLDGDTVVHGNALSKLSDWRIGIAAKKSELLGAAWNTVQWAVITGFFLLFVSLYGAMRVARSITRPINSLQSHSFALMNGETPEFHSNVPEIGDLWDALRDAIGERNRATSMLQHVTGRLAAIVTSSTDAIYSKTLDGTITSWNKSAERMFGYNAEEMIGRSARQLMPPDKLYEETNILTNIAAGRSVEALETVRHAKDGKAIEVSASISPIFDHAGKLVGASSVLRDITERKLRERQIKESNDRLSQILNTVNAFVGLLDSQGKFTEINLRALEASGLDREAVIGVSIVEAPWWLDGDREKIRSIIARSLEGEIVRKDLRYATGVGEIRWVDFQIAPIYSAGGDVVAVVPSGVDITDRKRSEEHARTLLFEVNHRSKNMLGLVSAIARQTVASNPREFMSRFSERIQALSSNQDMLVRNEWRGIEFAELVQAQLAPFADPFGARIKFDGPSIKLNPAAAQGIGMALHELATNASKYGALSNSIGRVEISWELHDASLSVCWQETGGPEVVEPVRRGFGHTVMTTLAQRSVSGDVSLSYEPGGLMWTLVCPLSAARDADPSPVRDIGKTNGEIGRI